MNTEERSSVNKPPRMIHLELESLFVRAILYHVPPEYDQESDLRERCS